MKKKLLTIILAAMIIFSMTAFAAEEEVQDTSDFSGYYIVNYSNSSDKVSLETILESDLIATAQQAETTIYYFGDDGSVKVYSGGTVEEGTFTAENGKLSIVKESGTEDYDYEIIDNLMIIRSDDSSSVLYSFELDYVDYITIEDYSALEISSSQVAVTESDIDSYINTTLQAQTTYTQITEGVTADGDIVTISYEGVLEGEDEPFEGGTSEGITLQLGTGSLIGNFEEQLTGKEIGSTFDVTVTFPDDYTYIEGMAGKTATFTTTILYKTEMDTPELTDEFVQEFTGTYLEEQLDTVDEFRDYCRDYLEDYAMSNAIMTALAKKATVSAYNSTLLQLLYNYSAGNLSYMASYYGYDADTYAQLVGYESADAYEQAEAVSNMNVAMLVNKVMVDEGITYNAEDLDAALAAYMKLSGYDSMYTIEEYKEQVGILGMWTFANLDYKFNLVKDALIDRVTIVDDQTADAETVAVEDTAEDVAEDTTDEADVEEAAEDAAPADEAAEDAADGE